MQQDIGYTVRLDPGIQSCEQTLEKALGSCRDTGWLLVQILRHLGLAARFVSGYLVQLKADEKALDGPSGPESDWPLEQRLRTARDRVSRSSSASTFE